MLVVEMNFTPLMRMEARQYAFGHKRREVTQLS